MSILGKTAKVASFTIPALIGATSIMAQDMGQARQDFLTEVRRNPLTNGGSWIEMKNAFNEWEKVILVFGFADPGDDAACEDIMVFAAEQNPARKYRCNPVN